MCLGFLTDIYKVKRALKKYIYTVKSALEWGEFPFVSFFSYFNLYARGPVNILSIMDFLALIMGIGKPGFF